MREFEPSEWVQIPEDDYAEKLESMAALYATMLEKIHEEMEQIRYWRDIRGHRISYYFNEEAGEMRWEHHKKQWGFRP